MPPCWTLLALALAGSPADSRLTGFDRLYVDPAALHLEPAEPATPPARGRLEIVNGHAARAVIYVGDQAVGELLPRATGAIRDLPAGRYRVRFAFADGVVRSLQLPTRPEPADGR